MIDNSVNNPLLTSTKEVGNYDFIVEDGETYLVCNTVTGDDSYKEDIKFPKGTYLNGYNVKAWEGQKLVVDEKHIALIVRKMIQEDGTILGITKVALNSESFMAASSFQLTEKGLKEAALFGKKDEFNGITENVISGLKIPAGTGMNGIDYFGEEAFK